jgi:predicted lipoprotein with Yx(FWY)xxD motif
MHRRSIRLSIASLGALAVLCAPLAASAAATAGPATISLSSTKLGMILTTNNGHTVFAFTKDVPNQNNCVTTPFCKLFWPALTTVGAPVAAPGVDASNLSTITLAGGVQQVTYFGHPLYGYILNIFPRATGYVGVTAFGGTWEALDATGTLITKP